MDPTRDTHTFSFRKRGERALRKYDVFQIWELSKKLPVIEVDIRPFYEKLGKNEVWATPQGLLEALDLAKKYNNKARVAFLEDHQNRVNTADLTCPILLAPEPKIGILDGKHRIVKAMWRGIFSLPAKRFQRMPEKARIR